MKKKLIMFLSILAILTSFSSVSFAVRDGYVLPAPIRDSIVQEM